MKTLILGAVTAAMLIVATPTDSEARPRRYYRNYYPGPAYRTYYRPYAYRSYYRAPSRYYYYRPYANRYYAPRYYGGPGISIGVY